MPFCLEGLIFSYRAIKNNYIFYRLQLQSKVIYYLAYIADESWAVICAGVFVALVVYLVQFLIVFSAS